MISSRAVYRPSWERKVAPSFVRPKAERRFVEHCILACPPRRRPRPKLVIAQAPQSINRVVQAVASVTGLPMLRLISEQRGRDVARPRQVGMYLCTEVTTHSLPVIGRAWGGRDHTTVMHARNVVLKRLEAGHEETVALVQRVREWLGVGS